MFGTASMIASPSRSDTPSDFLRISWRSSGFTSLALTITLRRPRRPMASRAFCSAPAPIDSIAITAPTPKIMPSMVRPVRSLCVARLPNAEVKVSRFSIACSFAVLLRVLQRDLVAGDEPFGDDDAARARGADRDRHALEAIAFLAIDELLSFLLEHGLPRNREGAGLALQLELRAHARAGLEELGLLAVELHGHAEVLHRLPRDSRAGHL